MQILIIGQCPLLRDARIGVAHLQAQYGAGFSICANLTPAIVASTTPAPSGVAWLTAAREQEIPAQPYSAFPVKLPASLLRLRPYDPYIRYPTTKNTGTAACLGLARATTLEQIRQSKAVVVCHDGDIGGEDLCHGKLAEIYQIIMLGFNTKTGDFG